MRKQTPKQDPDTTGHSWDGIEEFNNPLPKWWLWLFYLTIIWGVWYTVAYPAWPMLSKATAGYAGFSTRAELAEDVARADAANAEINARLAAAELTDIRGDDALNSYAQNAGAAVFRTWCAQCHGTGAAGAKGYPNLLDNDWLWGGDIDAIHYTISHGVRTLEDDDTHWSEMPAFHDVLDEEEIDQVVNFVQSLSGAARDASMIQAGAAIFEDNCSSCHMEDGTGDQSQGAPNLADAIWLYGGDYDTIKETVEYSRFGVMPNWNSRLTDAQIAAVAAYVHGLGGGE